MKISITGAGGFVGGNVTKYLKDGFDIRAITRNELSAVNEQILNDTESVIHLAGKAHDLKKSSNPQEYYQVNFELTKRLYNAFLSSRAKKFIFISSVKAAADRVDSILTEEAPPLAL